MSFIVQLTKKALADLLRLDSRDAGRIIKKLKYFANSPDPMRYAKPLMGQPIGRYRFRIGEYRAIFWRENENDTILRIARVGHRKKIYKAKDWD